MKLAATVALIGLLVWGCHYIDTQPETARLIIYTGRDKDEVAAVKALFEEKFPKYKGNVDTVILGAQAALDRLRAEKSNVLALQP